MAKRVRKPATRPRVTHGGGKGGQAPTYVQQLRVVVGAQTATPTRGRKRADPPITAAERQAIRVRYGLDGLDEIDRRLLVLVQAKPGMTDAELGVEVGMNRKGVNKRKNRPAFQAALLEASLDELAILSRLRVKAARALEPLLDDPDSRLRFDIARFVLTPVLKGQDGATGSGLEAFEQLVVDAARTDTARETGGAHADDGARSRGAAGTGPAV